MFSVIVVILAHMIRNDPSIKGIVIKGKEFKISQYANDNCMFLDDENPLLTALNILKLSIIVQT
jgi:hypothetical protein